MRSSHPSGDSVSSGDDSSDDDYSDDDYQDARADFDDSDDEHESEDEDGDGGAPDDHTRRRLLRRQRRMAEIARSANSVKARADRLTDRRDEVRSAVGAARDQELVALASSEHYETESLQVAPIRATSSFWKGDDWNAEERWELQQALAALGLGGLTAAFTILQAGLFGLGAAPETQRATEEQLGLDIAANSTAAGVSAHRYRAATYALSGQGWTVLAEAAGALGLLVVGVRKYWVACDAHAARIEAVNRPPETVARENLEASVLALTKRIEGELSTFRGLSHDYLRLANRTDDTPDTDTEPDTDSDSDEH